jgi:hypothetical protein
MRHFESNLHVRSVDDHTGYPSVVFVLAAAAAVAAYY